MAVWIKVAGNPPKIGWAENLSRRHNAWRRAFDGGFYASFSNNHVRPVIRGFQRWGLRVDRLDGPPNKSNAEQKERKRSLRNLQNGHHAEYFWPSKQRKIADAESKIQVFDTNLADVRSLAFSHSKADIAFLLGVSIRELNRVLENFPPLYFGYRCKRCKSIFQGEEALPSYKVHVLSCK